MPFMKVESPPEVVSDQVGLAEKEFRLFVSAGEASGDALLAATLVELKKLLPKGIQLILAGLGGPLSQAQGLTSQAPLTTLAVNGITDVIRQGPRLGLAYLRALRAWRTLQPHAVLLVDYPGMNLHFWRRAKRSGIPLLVLAPPQLWTRQASASSVNKWRSLAQGTAIQVLFPFEAKDWQEIGAEVEQGHAFDTEESLPTHSLSVQQNRNLLLCPGSRAAVMQRNLSAWLKAWQATASPYKGERVFILVPEALREKATQLSQPYGPNLMVLCDKNAVLKRTGMGPAGLEYSKNGSNSIEAICFPGTMTLELALAGIPFAAVGILDSLTLAWARKRIQVNHVALPNVLLHARHFPEWVGTEAQFGPQVFQSLRDSLLDLSEKRSQTHIRLVAALGNPSGGQRAAKRLLSLWKNSRPLRQKRHQDLFPAA